MNLCHNIHFATDGVVVLRIRFQHNKLADLVRIRVGGEEEGKASGGEAQADS